MTPALSPRSPPATTWPAAWTRTSSRGSSRVTSSTGATHTRWRGRSPTTWRSRRISCDVALCSRRFASRACRALAQDDTVRRLRYAYRRGRMRGGEEGWCRFSLSLRGTNWPVILSAAGAKDLLLERRKSSDVPRTECRPSPPMWGFSARSAEPFVSEPSPRSEEHTSELQSQSNLVCRLLLEKKKKTNTHNICSLKHAHIS